jgi:hypothetical protein
VRDWTVISIESGKLPCTVDPEAARQRDVACRNGWKPPMPGIPKLEGGILFERHGEFVAPAGELSVQGRVRPRHQERADLFDRFTPAGQFSIISVVARPRDALEAEQLETLERLGCNFAFVGSEDVEDADMIDVDGAYAAWFGERGVQVIVVRPDFHVFGGGPLTELPSIVSSLLEQLA